MVYSRYPQNLARNIGKQGCQTPFTTVPDTDMIPSANMAEKLEVTCIGPRRFGNIIGFFK